MIASSPYRFKPSPYSSHSLLLEILPRNGSATKLLDVGCADGYLSKILAERGYGVTAIETHSVPSPDVPRNFDFIEADLDRGLPEMDGPFEVIVCADVLEHLRDPLCFLRQLRNILAPGGWLAASLPNSGNLYFRLNVLFGRFPKHDRGLFDRTHLHFYTWDGWRELFANGGFSIQTVRPTGMPLGLAFPALEGSLLVRIAERLSYDAARLWKRLFAYQFVITAAPTENP